MLCKDCEHFHIDYPPKKGVDFGRASCDKHNLVTEFLDMRKFKSFPKPEWCDEEEEKTRIPTELYRLTLTHFIDDGEDLHRLEEPLVVQMIYDRRFTPQPICINRMLDMMRDELMRRAGEQE